MPRVIKSRFRDVLGATPKPSTVWQQQFDWFDDKLRSLARREWDEVPEGELWAYIHDLTYQELQPDLFRHLFPACLKFWYDSLMRSEPADRGDADFHRALLRGNILAKMLNDQERERVHALFVDGYLDRVELERGFNCERSGIPANAWIRRFNSIGLVAPIIPEIWRQWWSMDTPGRAISIMIYSSGLVYFKGENPIFPWTPDEGGGGPDLTELDSSEFESAWLTSNLSFLRTTLSPDYVLERMRAAADVLVGEPELRLANRIVAEASSRADVISLRIDDLLTNLSRPRRAQDLWDADWSQLRGTPGT